MNNLRLKLSLAFVMMLVVSSLYGVEFKIDDHPRLLINQDAIDHAKEKMQKYDWAKSNGEALIEFADNFKVPQRREFVVKRTQSQWPSLGYVPSQIKDLYTVGLAWTLTDNPVYLDKLKSFVLDVCDPEKGYIAVGAATTGVEVHEGGFFFYFAAICDILYSKEGVLTAEQKAQSELVMRAYLEKSKDEMHPNGIMNHQASTNSSAVLVSMLLQDEELFNHFVEADGGMMDHIATGFMPDGWWFEATVNYCYLVSDIYFRMAQVFQNNGMDLYHSKIPSRVMKSDFHNAPDEFTGMKFAVWGDEPKPYRTLHDVATAFYPLMDENGVVLASNDSGTVAPAEFYELAYKEYSDRELAWVLSKTKRDSWIALFYGEGKLPKVSDPRTKSATKENVGITALRSQNKSRQGAEQLQAYVKYGSHGGWHGHFDRTSLQALDKYGHKYFGTEMCWFGYGSAQYKELVQTTVTHNMVMVNQMQQQAVPSSQPLMYCGEMMQLSLTQTEAKWRPIPRYNLDKFPPWDDSDYATEPILQRRLSIVTDDYLVMVDYVSSREQREYDCLVHPLGFVGVEGAEKVGEELEFVTTDESSPYKYFPNCQWYKGGDDAVKFRFNDNGYGLDFYALYPKQADIMYAHYPTTGKVSQDFRNNPDRRTLAVRVNAKEAVFITLLEPYKGESVIEKIDVAGEDQITVHLKCGTTQRFTISELKGVAEDVKVEMVSTSKSGKTKREKN
ncbi:MAG: alginate lyase family protein [Rikenellaceae bacterium]